MEVEPAVWTPCPVCEEHGWADRKAAELSLARTTLDDGDGELAAAQSSAAPSVYSCSDGLWHTDRMSQAEWRRVVEPIELTLPSPPYRPPSERARQLPDYRTAIERLLRDAIRQAGPGKAFPARRAFFDRYHLGGSWIRVFRAACVREGLLRQVGNLYITSTPPGPDQPDHDRSEPGPCSTSPTPAPPTRADST